MSDSKPAMPQDFSPIRGPLNEFRRLAKGVEFSGIDLAKGKDATRYTIKCKCGCLLYDGLKPYTAPAIGCPSCKVTVKLL